MIVMFELFLQVCGSKLLVKNMEVLSTAQGTNNENHHMFSYFQ